MSELTSDHPVETFVAAMIENVQIVKLLIEDGHNMDREERDILILRAIELDAIPFNYEIFCSMTDIHKELVMEAMTRANHLYKHAYKQNQKPWPPSSNVIIREWVEDRFIQKAMKRRERIYSVSSCRKT